MKFLNLFLSFFMVLFFNSASFSQAPLNNNNADICTPEYTQTLVKQQISNFDSFTEVEKKIKILLKVAEFFWKTDKKQSLDYYKQAFEIAEKDFAENIQKREKNSSSNDYRKNVLREVVRKDAELAKIFKDKIAKDLKENIKNNSQDGRNSDIRSVLFLVADVAKSNPEMALQIGRTVTDFEIVNSWYFALYSIAGQNRDISDQLFREVLAKHPDAEVFRLLYLSAYPFAKERIFGIERNTMGMGEITKFQPDPNLQILFLNTLFNRILQLTPADTAKGTNTAMPETSIAISALNEIEPYMQQFPALQNKFYQAKTHASGLVSNEMLDSLKQREEWSDKTNQPIEAKIKNLEKLNSEGRLRDTDIFSVIFSLDEEKHFEQMEFWLLKISDLDVSQAAKEFFYHKRSRKAIEDKRFDDARKYAEKVSELIFKANLYFEIAQGELKTKNDKFSVDSLLNKVYINANKAEDSAEKAQIFFGLAKTYADFDMLQAFQSLSKAIEITNSLENPDIFKNYLSIKIEIPKQGSFYASYNTIGLNMEEVFVKLSGKDFGQTIGQAESFSDPYFRTIAVISSINECQRSIKRKASAKN